MHKNTKTYKSKEAAQLLGVSYCTVIRWIKSGKLPGYSLPGRGDTRICQNDLKTFMENNNMPIPEELCNTNLKCLIVEDDQTMQDFIGHCLTKLDFKTEYASNGFKAGQVFTEFEPDIITLDLNMPCLNGIDLLKYLNEQGFIRQTKVIVISSSIDKKEQALELGAHDFLLKPIKVQELENSIKKAF